MGYEYEFKEYIRDEILSNINHMNLLDDALDELDHVYSQAAKADEYEVKVKILDRVKEFATEPPFLLANNEHEDYELYAYDQILRLIEKYESGESE